MLGGKKPKQQKNIFDQKLLLAARLYKYGSYLYRRTELGSGCSTVERAHASRAKLKTLWVRLPLGAGLIPLSISVSQKSVLRQDPQWGVPLLILNNECLAVLLGLWQAWNVQNRKQMKNLGFFTETQPKQDTVKILSLTFAVPRSPFVICASGQNLKNVFSIIPSTLQLKHYHSLFQVMWPFQYQ